MQLAPIPNPCSSLDAYLHDIDQQIITLHTDCMSTKEWTVEYSGRLLSAMSSLILALRVAEQERVRKILGQI